MFAAFRAWRRRRLLARHAIPDALWRETLDALPFLDDFAADELARLRAEVVLFLEAKSIVGAGGHEVTPLQRVIVAAQACVLVLGLDASVYDGWESVIVYPAEFVPRWEWEDEAGVVHESAGPLVGEAMPRGPVVLSWPDVEASADWEATGMNLVIHEFAHKIDMQSGEADGCPPLHPDMDPRRWRAVMTSAYEDFVQRTRQGETTAIDPYAAEAPAEFFAVLSEVFFAEPCLLRDEYPDVYREFVAFYRQDPALRHERAVGRRGQRRG